MKTLGSYLKFVTLILILFGAIACGKHHDDGIEYHGDLTGNASTTVGHATGVLNGSDLALTITYSGFVATKGSLLNANNGNQPISEFAAGGSPIKKTVQLNANQIEDLNAGKFSVEVFGTINSGPEIRVIKGVITK